MSKILKAFYIESKAVNAFRNAFWYLIVDSEPNFVYNSRLLTKEEKYKWEVNKRQFLYWAKDDPFFSSFVHELGSKGAFADREMTLTMQNGTKETFVGDLWSSGQNIVNPNSAGVGAATVEQLKEYYVFYSHYIDAEYFAKWLVKNPDKVFKYERGAL